MRSVLDGRGQNHASAFSSAGSPSLEQDSVVDGRSKVANVSGAVDHHADGRDQNPRTISGWSIVCRSILINQARIGVRLTNSGVYEVNQMGVFAYRFTVAWI